MDSVSTEQVEGQDLFTALYEMMERAVTTSLYEMDKLFDYLVQRAAKLMKASACTLRLFEEGSQELVLRAFYGLSFSYTEKPALKIGEGIAGLVFREGKPIAISDILKDSRYIYRAYAIKERIHALISNPLRIREQLLGTLTVYYRSVHRFRDEEMKFFGVLSEFLSLVITEMRLRLEAQRHYMDTVQTLIKPIEAKDPYTGGHSERVARLARRVGEHLGLAGPQLQILSDLALLHDIGKIGVSDAVLRKPAKLSGDEFGEIKRHIDSGKKILSSLAFLRALLPAVVQHHERYDGNGYPNGIGGEKIHFMARIVAIVDAYDAMTSNRPYREALGKREALLELKTNKFKQFDPKVVDAFAEVVEKLEGCPNWQGAGLENR